LLSKGEIIVRDLSSDEQEGKTIEAIGIIRSGIDDVYQVLIDFEDYDKFMPNNLRAEILEQDSNRAIINYILDLPIDKTIKYRLTMSYGRNEKQAWVNWIMMDWPGLETSETIKNTTGYWLITPHPDQKESVIALYHVYVDPGEAPFGLGWIINFLTYYSVPSVLINTKERVLFLTK